MVTIKFHRSQVWNLADEIREMIQMRGSNSFLTPDATGVIETTIDKADWQEIQDAIRAIEANKE